MAMGKNAGGRSAIVGLVLPPYRLGWYKELPQCTSTTRHAFLFQSDLRGGDHMSRCTSKTELEVHHKRRDGGNGFDNAELLCQDCHEATETYGKEGPTPPAFGAFVKTYVRWIRARNRCECTREGGCH